MAFGKRQFGVGAAAHALNADMAVAQSQVVTETAGATGSPIRWIILLIACGAGLIALFVNYARTSCATIAWPEPGSRRMSCAPWKGSASEQTS